MTPPRHSEAVRSYHLMINQIKSYLSATEKVVEATKTYLKQMEEINMSYMSEIDIERQNSLDIDVSNMPTSSYKYDTAMEIQALQRAKNIFITLANESGELSEDGELSHAETLEKERTLLNEREMIWKFLGYRLKRIEDIDNYLKNYDGHPELSEPTIPSFDWLT